MTSKWIESEGGPLVVIPTSVSSAWSGYRGDYDDACSIDALSGKLHMNLGGVETEVIVIGDEPLRTTYLRDHSAIVQWRHADSEEDIYSGAWVISRRQEWRPGPKLQVSGRLAVFDAAAPGDELDDVEVLVIDPPGGFYELRSADIDVDSRTAIRVHKFFPVGSTGLDLDASEV